MRILFFMNTGGLTGSEVALHNFIWHAALSGWEMAVACEFDGELLGRMPPGVQTFVYGYRTPSLGRRLYSRARRALPGAGEVTPVEAIHRQFRPDAWYVNTCSRAELVRQAERIGVPCVMHTHELAQVLWNVPEPDVRLMVEYPALVVACSENARAVFRTLGRESNIEVCYENINPSKIVWDEGRAREIRRGLGVGEKTFVWAMSGTLDPNKNPLRFVEIAAEMLRAGLDVHFVWIGGSPNGYSLHARRRAEELGVAGKVSWVGQRSSDYYDHLGAADGLVLTSYNESFSIVTVEAAYLGKPVVSFNCGGVREIVREGMGSVIDSWNNSDLIAAMAAVMRGETPFDPQAARRRALEFDIAAQGERWVRVVREHLSPHPR